MTFSHRSFHIKNVPPLGVEPRESANFKFARFAKLRMGAMEQTLHELMCVVNLYLALVHLSAIGMCSITPASLVCSL